MSKRLEVLMEEPEYREIHRVARTRGLTVAEWVRGALREAARREPAKDRDQKLGAIRAADLYELPTSDIETMLASLLPPTGDVSYFAVA